MTLFDHDDLEKVKKTQTWYVTEGGYVLCSGNKKYLHHLVMDFVGTGRGFQQESIDHIDRNPLNNRKTNLRRASVKEQQENSKGVLEGTKRERKETAPNLPEGITQDMIPKYVSYRTEEYKEYFIIEHHPLVKLTVNGHGVKSRIKSVQAQWEYHYARVKYDIKKKLAEITEVVNKMDEIYEVWKRSHTDNNVVVPEDDIVKKLIVSEVKPTKSKVSKNVYKYDMQNNFVEEYSSIVEAAMKNNISDKTVSRVIKSGNHTSGGFYFRTIKTE
jgi:hypothetical protein